MSKNEMDPAASTQQFRAFAQSSQPEPSGPRVPVGMIVLIAVVVAVVAAVIAGIALS
jgi:hypothetical protein